MGMHDNDHWEESGNEDEPLQHSDELEDSENNDDNDTED